MINNATKYNISGIFDIDTQIKYVIPKFQREYTWSKNEWEELLNDIMDSEGGHYIGSIICINKEADALRPELELIDGQQRLITLSLLFCAIYKSLNEKIPNNDENLRSELWNLKYRLIQKHNEGNLKIELSEQNNNFDDYKSILNEIGIFEFNRETRHRGNRRIYKAFKYFLSRIEELEVDELIDFLKKIVSTMLVKIEVDSHSDAFMLFESLNNRGVPLSATDLIKNKMLAELDRQNIMSIDDAFEKWKKIINNLPDYSIQERFLRQYYNAFKYDKELIKIGSIAKATKSNLIKIYEGLVERNPEFIFDELVNKSSIYYNLILPEEAEREPYIELKNELRDLLNVKAAPSYTLLLYLFSLNSNLDVNFYRETINFLVKYFIRRNITDFPNTRNLDQIFFDLIDRIENSQEQLTSEFIIKFLSDKDRISNLETFIERLNGDIYDLNVDATRFVLSKIEESKSTREIYLNFWARENNKLIWTIEHIFPEGKNIPESWINMMANGNRNEAKQIQEDWVHKLGNLTLTGYNQNLSNLDFERKRDRQQNNKYIGYKNGIFLNEDLKDKNIWAKNDIIKRTKKIVDLAVKIFKLEQE